MTEILTLQDVAERTGESVDRLRQWRDVGLIGSTGNEECAPEDVERVRLIQHLLRREIALGTITRAEKEQAFLTRYVESIFPSGAIAGRSILEAAREIGLDVQVVRRFREASGLSDDMELLDAEDIEALRAFKGGLDGGFPEEAMVQLLRVYNDALARVAEAEQRLFHFYVHDRRKAEGLSGEALIEAGVQSRDRLLPLIEPAIAYFHRKGWQRAVREDAVLHLKEDPGLIEKGAVPGKLSLAVAFVDLSGFTSLVEAMGDQTAVQVLERFSSLVREQVRRCDGRVVKQIGDAFMLVFQEPRTAVVCAAEIDRRVAEEPHFPAVRSGVQWGPVLYREGDYVGANVNVAARLASEAQRHQVLVTAAVRKAAGSLEGVDFVPLGNRRLKGLVDELEVFEVRRTETHELHRLVDPVCGMELDPAEVVARLSFTGRERWFCSQQCLQQFVAAPERYEGRSIDRD